MQFESLARTSRRRWLSLTSLIDVVFLLLIFFMLTTSFSQQRTLSLDIPAEKGKGSNAWQGSSLVRVHGQGVVDFNGRRVQKEEIAQRTAQLLEKRPQTRFIVRPDAGLPLQQVVSVMDQLREGGASVVSLIR